MKKKRIEGIGDIADVQTVQSDSETEGDEHAILIRTESKFI